MKLLFPREHGAWGIVLIPFLTAVAIAGRFSLAVPVGLLVVLLAFLARYPLELLLLPGRRAHPAGHSPEAVRRWAATYSILAVALGLGLVVGWRLYLLIPLSLLAVALFGAHVWAARHGRQNGTRAELLGTAGLTLSAPVGWVAATGGVDTTGVLVWLLNLAFFASGVLYVRSRIRERQAARRPEAKSTALFVVGFHAGMLLFVAALAYWLQASLLVAVPFLAAAGRAAWPPRRPSEPLNLRRLGWTEVGLSIFFAGCLTLGFHL